MDEVGEAPRAKARDLARRALRAVVCNPQLCALYRDGKARIAGQDVELQEYHRGVDLGIDPFGTC